jgi:hypothetical protein
MPPIARHAFAAIVLAAAAGSAAEAQQAQHLECAGPFARDATAGTLVSVFGAANVVNGTIDGPEGSTLDATLVFPEDPARRLALLWQDEVSRARPAAILIQDRSEWVGPGGIRLGTTLAEVEAANGAPFNILGFGWDYGGSAGFEEGTLADLPGGCVLSLTFQIDESVEGPEFDAIMGDKQFRSDNPLIRKAAPTVSQIAVGYPME